MRLIAGQYSTGKQLWLAATGEDEDVAAFQL
jgi:hypothetical protein